MFQRAALFNDDISDWDTSNVIVLAHMFDGASNFNQNIDYKVNPDDSASWDVSKVWYMEYMFKDAVNFNGNIAHWNTESARNVINMFNGAKRFNGDISAWNTHNVDNMFKMFMGASAFNQDISAWNTSKVVNMAYMFKGAATFNQNINTVQKPDGSLSWDVSKVIYMDYMFAGAVQFNGDISAWQTGNVMNMSNMFENATALKQIDLSNRASASQTPTALGIFYGTSPNVIKFDKLASFSWQLPANYQIKKGDVGSQTTEYQMAGSTYTFDSGARYELQKLPIEANITLNDIEKTYDGKAITAQYLSEYSVVNPANISGEWQLQNDNIRDVGDYTLNVTFKPDNGDYFNQQTFAVRVVINAKPLTLPALIISKAWDGTTAATVNYDVNAVMADVIAGDRVNIAPIVGTYDTAEVGGDKIVSLSGGALDNANYSLAVPNNVPGEIKKATPTAAVEAQLDAVYGDTLSDVDVVGSGAGTWQFEGDLDSAVGRVGSHRKTVVFTPADTVHYTTKSAITTLKVAKKALTLRDPIVAPKLYDNTTAAAISYGGLVGLVDGDAPSDVRVASISAHFENAVAGEAKNVIVTAIELVGAKAANYSIVYPQALTGTIAKNAPAYTVPTNLTARYGDRLDSVELPTAADGIWQFADGSAILNQIGSNTVKLYFIPNNDNYSRVEIDVVILVSKAETDASNGSDESANEDGTEDDIVPDSSEDDALPESTEDAAVPESTEDDTVPDSTEDAAAPKSTEDAAVPKSTEDDTVPDSTEDAAVPKSTEDAAVPKSTEDETVPESTEDDAVPESTEDAAVPESTEDAAVPESTEDETVPESTEDDAETDNNATIPEDSQPDDEDDEDDDYADTRDADGIDDEKTEVVHVVEKGNRALPKPRSQAGFIANNELQKVIASNKVEQRDRAQTAATAKIALVETANFDIASDVSQSTEAIDQSVNLNNGVVNLIVEKPEVGKSAKLELKPKKGYKVAELELYDDDGDRINYIIDEDGLFNFLIPLGKLSVNVKFAFILPERPTFNDVPLTHPNALAIEHLVAEKIMIGVSKTLFDPAGTLNRATIIKILHNLTGNPQEDSALEFADVNLGSWYDQALQWAAKAGIAKGYSKTEFAPLATLNKEQFITFLYRYEMRKQTALDKKYDFAIYADGATVSGYARAAIGWALDNSLIKANGKGELNVNKAVSRAEVAEIIHRYLER